MKRILLLTLVFSFTVFAVQAQEAPAPVGIDTLCGERSLEITALDEMPEDATTQALDTILRQLVTLPTDELPPLSAVQPKPPAPGAVIFVDSPEGRYFRSIGAVDVESCVFVDPEMRFPIGSNTKMFTAAVIFQLHEEGLLSTSDLVSQYLPEEIALFPGAETATIDMLLTHTSGLPDYLNSTDPATLGGRMGAGDWDVLGESYTPEELVAQAASQPLVFAPGAEAQWAYSNTGYIMLGQIIEQVTGKTYIEAVTERVIERLGMANTVLVAAVPPAELGLATQYIASPFTVNTSGWNFTQAWSAGNAVSTPEDMAIFLRAYYTGALFQNPETLEALMTRATVGNNLESDDFYYLHGGYYKGGFLGHGGQTLGTESDVGYHPATDTVVVTWANSSEAGTGRGIYHIGHALGITPTWDEVYNNLPAVANQPTFEDVVGRTLELSGVVIGSTQEPKAPAEGSTYSAIFNADGSVNIVADCNTVTASYTTGDASAITIELGASTRVACPEGSIADDFLAVLGEATVYRVISIGDLLLVVIATPDQSNVSFNVAQ